MCAVRCVYLTGLPRGSGRRGLWGLLTVKLVSKGRRGPGACTWLRARCLFTTGLGIRGHFQSHVWLWTEHNFSPFERLTLPCAGPRGPWRKRWAPECGHGPTGCLCCSGAALLGWAAAWTGTGPQGSGRAPRPVLRDVLRGSCPPPPRSPAPSAARWAERMSPGPDEAPLCPHPGLKMFFLYISQQVHGQLLLQLHDGHRVQPPDWEVVRLQAVLQRAPGHRGLDAHQPVLRGQAAGAPRPRDQLHGPGQRAAGTVWPWEGGSLCLRALGGRNPPSPGTCGHRLASCAIAGGAALATSPGDTRYWLKCVLTTLGP